MSLVYTLIIIASVAALTSGAFFVNKRIKFLPLLKKILAIAILPVAFYRYLIEHEAVMWVRGLNMTLIPGYEIPFGDAISLTVISILLIWFSWAAMLTVIMNEFYKLPVLSNLVKLSLHTS